MEGWVTQMEKLIKKIAMLKNEREVIEIYARQLTNVDNIEQAKRLGSLMTQLLDNTDTLLAY